MPDNAMPPFILSPNDHTDSDSTRRAQAVVAALELARAKYLGGDKSRLIDVTANLLKMADNIQRALKTPNPESVTPP